MKKLLRQILIFVLITANISGCSKEKSTETTEDEVTETEQETAKPEKTQAAFDAEALIDEIGEVTLDSKELIITAYAAYNALTDDEKESVDNSDILASADNQYANLVIDKLSNEKLLTRTQANEYIENYYTENSELLTWIELINDMNKCSGVFYNLAYTETTRSGEYSYSTPHWSEIEIDTFLQYGEIWCDIDNIIATEVSELRYVDDFKLFYDGENGFIFKSNTSADYYTMYLSSYGGEPKLKYTCQVDISIRVGENKLYLEYDDPEFGATWIGESFYASRTKETS